MEKLKIVLLFIVLYGSLCLCAFPLLYDSSVEKSDLQNYIKYKLQEVPSGSVIRFYSLSADGTSSLLAEKTIEAEISAVIKDSCMLQQQELPLENVVCEIEYYGIFYPEMVYIPSGKYPVCDADNKISQISSSGYFISKYEITNNQFMAFINADGYEIEEYWIIAEGLMKDPTVGWYYQGLRQITKPIDWDTSIYPYYQNSYYSQPQQPAAGVTWFEANAFCSWLNGTLPTYEQLISCFDPSLNTSTDGFNITSRVKNVSTGAAEWTCSNIPASGPSCGRCNEMRLLENSADHQEKYPVSRYKCPLFRFENLGFRIVTAPDSD